MESKGSYIRRQTQSATTKPKLYVITFRRHAPLVVNAGRVVDAEADSSIKSVIVCTGFPSARGVSVVVANILVVYMFVSVERARLVLVVAGIRRYEAATLIIDWMSKVELALSLVFVARAVDFVLDAVLLDEVFVE